MEASDCPAPCALHGGRPFACVRPPAARHTPNPTCTQPSTSGGLKKPKPLLPPLQKQQPQPKERTGTIERIAPDGASAICRGMFKRETDVTPFLGATVTTGRGEAGAVEGRFGGSGKFRVAFPPPGLAPAGERGPGDNALVLRYKKFVHGGKGAAGRIQQ